MEFILPKAKDATFPDESDAIEGGEDFTSTDYKRVEDDLHLQLLLNAQFANVKYVDSIWLDGWPRVAGYGQPGIPSLILAHYHHDPDNGVGPVELNGRIAMHEYGHTAGIEHRGVPLPDGTTPNAGDPHDTTALMHRYYPNGDEVNRFERGKFETWHPALWND